MSNEKHALKIPDGLVEWAIQQAQQGAGPQDLVRPLIDAGWEESDAAGALDVAMHEFLQQHARASGLPAPQRVPSPTEMNGDSVIDAGDREVRVLANMLLPRLVVLGGLLSDEECDALIALAKPKLARSTTVDPDSGGDLVHADRTSRGMFFRQGENALCMRIERRIARLLDWPIENGEGLQVLNYGPGAEYKPHHDYFDPATSGSSVTLRRGGQRVASVVMYLNTPERGGATVFPDAHFEVSAIKGNAVFFSYDRPHPMTKTLHGGAPVRLGEKWIMTKWLRAERHA